METLTQKPAATFESVWALMQENAQQIEKSRNDFERRMKKYEETMGSWANNHGSFAEEYFFNSFENGKQNFFGEKFDEIKKNLRSFAEGLGDEYDIVMYNCASVAIVEVKFKAHEDHIAKVLKKAETFRIFYPHYRDYNIYLGLAALSFHEGVEDKCINEGIAVIKQVGDTVVINDAHLKIF